MTMAARRRRIIIDSDSDDELFLDDMLQHVRSAKKIRDRPDNLEEWSEEEFFMRFRITKQTTRHLMIEINDFIKFRTDRNSAISPTNQLLLTLRYYATGGTLTSVGDFAGVHKTTAGRVVKRVSEAIAFLRPQYIKLPQTEEEIEQAQVSFFQIAAFPRVVGSMDCTHVKVKSPGGDMPEEFRNRKGYFSINVQTVCDSKLKIRDIVARWPGSTHDVTIFNNSVLKARLERGDFRNGVIICDSGYGPSLHLLPPFRNPRTPAENLYNEALIRTRNTVERQYGVLKARFPVLALGIQLQLENVQAVIVACAVLHNIAIDSNEPEPPVDLAVQARVIRAIEDGDIPLLQEVGGPEAARQTFVQYFEGLR
ncbi:putative nuclease HARBI1 [Bacillus rossius redtenbacheri]|uniref:putative nuclease HARBI1 n=1 Tax=Bacillus rossius redtenbacheri TaxID=93214 RepID=UPI002FDEEFDD